MLKETVSFFLFKLKVRSYGLIALKEDLLKMRIILRFFFVTQLLTSLEIKRLDRHGIIIQERFYRLFIIILNKPREILLKCVTILKNRPPLRHIERGFLCYLIRILRCCLNEVVNWQSFSSFPNLLKITSSQKADLRIGKQVQENLIYQNSEVSSTNL